MNHRLTNRFAIGVLSLLLFCGVAPTCAKGAESADKDAEEQPTFEAVSLGEYLIRDFRVVEGSKLRISFELYAQVEEEDAESFRQLADSHEHRIRNEVLVAVRTCEQADFQEPDLDRMRRRILARLKRTMRMQAIQGLLVGEFEFFND